MALMKCAECGQQVSTAAAACPACGRPPKKTSRGTKLAAVLLGLAALIVVISIADKGGSPAKTASAGQAIKPITEADVYWDRQTSEHKALVVAGLNKVRREDSRCSEIDPGSTGYSPTKSTPSNPAFFVTCGTGAGAFNVYFSKSDVDGGEARAATQHLAKGRAIELCERYVKSVARHPSTVDFSRVIDLGFVEHPNGRTTVRSKFTARNSFNLETTHDVRCLLDKNGLIEGNFHESR